jgi:hypothetical protein
LDKFSKRVPLDKNGSPFYLEMEMQSFNATELQMQLKLTQGKMGKDGPLDKIDSNARYFHRQIYSSYSIK